MTAAIIGRPPESAAFPRPPEGTPGAMTFKKGKSMEKIASFTVNHLKLEPGIYVSGNVTLTTFDLRMTAPNREPVMNTAELHTIEHLGATFLRNDPQWKDRVVYFGPMGCRTGCYVRISSQECLNSSGTLRVIFRAPRQETAATIWIRILVWQSGLRNAIWITRCTALRKSIWSIRSNDERSLYLSYRGAGSNTTASPANTESAKKTMPESC